MPADSREPTDDPSSWERIRWSDEAPLPEAGFELPTAAPAHVAGFGRRVVLSARPDFEPGWIQVEVESA